LGELQLHFGLIELVPIFQGEAPDGTEFSTELEIPTFTKISVVQKDEKKLYPFTWFSL
jgi:hypothetical protein